MTTTFPTRPTAIVCDMDGLLVDSERLELRVWQAAATDMGVELTDERFATFVGHDATHNNAQLRAYYGEAFDIPTFRDTCHRHMQAILAREPVALRRGAGEWIAFVKSLGLPMALATSSGPHLVQERLGPLLREFDAVATRADVERGKPHPDLYLVAARRLGVPPEQCLALEDSPTGARAAIAAGMPVLIVPDLVMPPDELRTRAAGVYESLDAVREAAARAWRAD